MLVLSSVARRLDVEDLREQVVGHRPAPAGQRRGPGVRVGAPGEGEGGEAQAGRPASRPRHDGLHRGRGEVDAGPAEQDPRLAGREGEIGHPDLDHRAVEPVTVEREQRVRPGQQQKPQPAVGAPEEEVEPGTGVRGERGLTVERERDRGRA